MTQSKSEDADATTKRSFLLLGNVRSHEGITSSIKASGRTYVTKLLQSGVPNWQGILKLLALRDGPGFAGVIAKLSPTDYVVMCHPDRAHLLPDLFEAMSQHKHVVFVYDDLLRGFPSSVYSGLRRGWRSYPTPSEEQLSTVNALLKQYDLNVIPYRRSAEVTSIGQQFVIDADDGLLLRFYIPARRLWANQTATLLRLFRDYVSSVWAAKIRLSEAATANGTSYSFYLDGEESQSPLDLQERFHEFTNFLDLCLSDPTAASAALIAHHVDARRASEIVNRYSIEAGRLRLDLRQDAEQKQMALRHRLEAELLDPTASPEIALWIDGVVAQAIPSRGGLKDFPSLGMATSDLPPSGTGSRPEVARSDVDLEDVIQEEVAGLSLSVDQRMILRLIGEHASGAIAASLHRDLFLTADPAGGGTQRLEASLRLKKFLIDTASVVGSAPAETLIDSLPTNPDAYHQDPW